MNAFNSTWKKLKKEEPDLSTKTLDKRCSQAGWAAVTNAGFEKGEDGKWHKKAGESEEMEFLKPMFGITGGKSRQISHLVPIIPEHQVYVEPFAGGAAVFFDKDPSDKEVLADADSEIVAFFRFVQAGKPSDFDKLKKYDYSGSKKRFLEIRDKEPKTPTDRAFRLLYLSYWGFGGWNFLQTQRWRGKKRPNMIKKGQYPSIIDKLDEYRDRLRDVKILEQDYKKTITEWDSPQTFFYIDPPYKKKFLEELAEILPSVKGKWILSFSDIEEVRSLFKGFQIIKYKTRRTVSKTSNNLESFETAIMNFDPAKEQRRAFEELLAEHTFEETDVWNFGTWEVNYFGGKAGMLDFIKKNVPKEAKTAFDGFGGSFVVSYLFKQMGLQVSGCDRLRWPYHLGKGLIENNSAKLSDADIEMLFTPDPKAPKLVEESFVDTYFTRKNARIIDTIRYNADKLKGYKHHLALAALGAACVASVAFGSFSGRNKTVSRIKKNQDLRKMFLRKTRQMNGLIFDNGEKHQIHLGDFFEVAPKVDAQVAYLDPPYISVFSTSNSYERYYHFIEGLMTYWEGKEIDKETSSKIYKIKSQWTKTKINDLFSRMFQAVRKIPVIMVSYRDKSFPSPRQIRDMIEKIGRNYARRLKKVRYKIGSTKGTSDAGKYATEYLHIGWISSPKLRVSFISGEDLIEPSLLESPILMGGPIAEEIFHHSPNQILVSPNFVSLIGSTVDSEKNPADIDILFKAETVGKELSDSIRQAVPEEYLPYLEEIAGTLGPVGPHIGIYDLVLQKKPTLLKESPVYSTKLMEPIPAELETGEVVNLSDLPERSQWICERDLKGSRIMLHRSRSEVAGFDATGSPFELPEDLKASSLELQHPECFLLDGVLDSKGVFSASDILWFGESELIRLPLRDRKLILGKMVGSEMGKIRVLPFFVADTIEQMKMHLCSDENRLEDLEDYRFIIRDAGGSYTTGSGEARFKFLCPVRKRKAEILAGSQISLRREEVEAFLSQVTGNPVMDCFGFLPSAPISEKFGKAVIGRQPSLRLVESQYQPETDEDRKCRFVLQLHQMGDSIHLDLRMQTSKTRIVGWTLSLQKGDPKTFYSQEEYSLLAETKAPETTEWMNPDIEIAKGVGEGSLRTVDSGTVEYGAQLQGFHEYWLKGSLLKGRFTIRKMTSGGESPVTVFLLQRPNQDNRPYVLSKKAVEKKWMPPSGFSSLPSFVRKQIPKAYHFWMKMDALAVRDALVSKIQEVQPGAGVIEGSRILQTKKPDSSRILKSGLRCFATTQLTVQEDEIKNIWIIKGLGIEAGELIGMDLRPLYMPAEVINRTFKGMIGQNLCVMHGDGKRDVVGYIEAVRVEGGKGYIERAVCWSIEAVQLIKAGKLRGFSVEVIPETRWDDEHKREVATDAKWVGLALVDHPACKTCLIEKVEEATPTYKTKKIEELEKRLQEPMRTFLSRRYEDEEASIPELVTELGVSAATLHNWMTHLGVERRTLKEAAKLRESKTKMFSEGGRLVFLGTGSEDGTPIPGCGCPQCTEARQGGLSQRTHSCMLLEAGDHKILFDAGPDIVDQLAMVGVKPTHILVTSGHPAYSGGLRSLGALKAQVYATGETWRLLSKDLGFDKKSYFEVGKKFNIGRVEIYPFRVKFSSKAPAVGFKVTIGERVFAYCPVCSDIPDKKIIRECDPIIMDGSSLERDIESPSGATHASMKRIMRWAEEAEIPRVIFTNIGHHRLTARQLSEKLQDFVPKAGAAVDGSVFYLRGGVPGIILPDDDARKLITGEKTIIVQPKPYQQYSRQAILLCGDEVYGLLVLGMPQGPYPVKQVRDQMRREHRLGEAEWKKRFSDVKQVWIYRPRILSAYAPPKKYDKPLQNQLFVKEVVFR